MFKFNVKMQPPAENSEDTYQTQQIQESQDWFVRNQHHFLMVRTAKLLQSALVTPPSLTHHLLLANPAALECQDFFRMKCLSPTDSVDHPAVMLAVLYVCPPTMTIHCTSFTIYQSYCIYLCSQTDCNIQNNSLKWSQEGGQTMHWYHRNAAFMWNQSQF